MRYMLILFLILIGVMSRIYPYAPNFTPMLSIALLSGFYSKNRFLVMLPILIMLFSDIIIGNHSIVPWVYSSFILIFALGYFVERSSYYNIFFYSVMSSLIFFFVSNLGVWFTGGYSYTFSGLVICYTAAIPFFKNTLISTIFYSAAIHSVVSVVSSYSKQLRVNQ